MYTGIRLYNIRREYRMILYEKIKKNKTNSFRLHFLRKFQGLKIFRLRVKLN